MINIRKSAHISIEATMEQVFSVITDYDGHAGWIADVIHSQVLVQEGDIAVAEFISPELMEGKYVLEFVHTRPSSVVYQEVNQYRMGAAPTSFLSKIMRRGRARTRFMGLSGSWRIKESDDGKGVVLTGEMRLRATLWRIYAYRRILETLLRNRLRSAKDEALFAYSLEGGFSTGEDAEAEDGRKILEIVQRGENIEVLFLGEKYELRNAQREIFKED